ncbi:MAG: LacI family transcriptional regulator [Actinobacteria bacterium]|nr:LacI family transcriptional regulator [Actinomycetota bacterium]
MPTIDDVAKKARVSKATVSHVINDTRYVRNETKRRVMKTIEELGYNPSRIARSLATGKTNIIGCIVSDIDNPFFSQLVRYIEKAAAKENLDLFLIDTDYNLKKMRDSVHRLINLKTDGVIIVTGEVDLSVAELLSKKRIPTVLFDQWNYCSDFVSNITLDYSAGICQAIDYLINKGHSKIGFIRGSLDILGSKMRHDIFVQEIKKLLPFIEPIVEEGDFKIDGGLRAMNKVLRLKNIPTAMITTNDLMAIGALKAIRDKGLNVPEDISIIGHDDIRIASLIKPSLTTIAIPVKQIANLIMEILSRAMNSKRKKGIETAVKTNLIIRGSTAVVSKK